MKLDLPLKKDTIVQFEGIGIRRVTNEEAKKSLEMRRNKRIDPFKLGFKEKNFNKEAVKLCFQVVSYQL